MFLSLGSPAIQCRLHPPVLVLGASVGDVSSTFGTRSSLSVMVIPSLRLLPLTPRTGRGEKKCPPHQDLIRRTFSPKTFSSTRLSPRRTSNLSRFGHRGVFNPVGGSRAGGITPDAIFNIGRGGNISTDNSQAF